MTTSTNSPRTGGRQALEPGQVGTIRTDPYDSSSAKMAEDDSRRPAYFQAVAYYGAGDGTRKRKKARGASRTAAERELRKAVRDAVKLEQERAEDAKRGTEIPRDWTGYVARHAAFIAAPERNDYSAGTRRVYGDVLRNHMQDLRCPFHGRRLDEITEGELRDWLQSVADERGNGTTKTLKAVASTMLEDARIHGIIPVNYLYGMKKLPKRSKATEERLRLEAEEEAKEKGLPGLRMRDSERALTTEDWERIEAHLTAPAEEDAEAKKGPGRPRRQDGDVLDLLRFMYAEGTRIGEALGLLWEDVHEDAEEPHVDIRFTVVREGRRVFLAPPKTDNSVRTIYITPETATLLRRRRAEDESQGGHERPNSAGTVFPSTAGTLWEIRGAARKMRAVFDHKDVNVPWATTHTLRHTMITDSSKAGVPLSEISQKAGHRRAATTLGYFDTKTPSTTVGTKLEEHRKAGRTSDSSEAK